MLKSKKFIVISIIILYSYNIGHGHSYYIQHTYLPNYYNYYNRLPQIEPTQYYYYHYQPQQAPLYMPADTYYDYGKGKLQSFPGGGVPILVDYYKRCAHNFVGIKAHPVLPQYYYVCKIDSVIFSKCHNLQVFNSTINQCVFQPLPDYISNCNVTGRYPIYSDCHLYYTCNEELKTKIFFCPNNMIFSPMHKMCIWGNECMTQIATNYTQILQKTSDDFPICLHDGTFRSPIDCSLYYKCDMQQNGIFLQIRYKCPKDKFYDLFQDKCLPKHQVLCDCIPIALYTAHPLTLQLSRPLTVHQFHFDGERLEDINYQMETVNTTTMATKIEEMNYTEEKEMLQTTTVPFLETLTPSLNNFNNTINNSNNISEQDDEENLEEYSMNSEGFIELTQSGHATKHKYQFDKHVNISNKTTESDHENNAETDASGDGPIEVPITETLTDLTYNTDNNDLLSFTTTEVEIFTDNFINYSTPTIIETVDNTAIDYNITNLPRLQIVAEQPLDVHFMICPNSCTKNHTHNFETSNNRAVLIKWFGNYSNKTIALEAVN